MSTKHWVSILLVGVALGCGVAEAGAESASDLFQRSYDAEAAGKVGGRARRARLHARAAQHDGYVTQLRRGWLLYELGQEPRGDRRLRQGGRARAEERGGAGGGAAPGDGAPPLGGRGGDGAREVLRIDPGNYLANLRMAFAVYNLGRYPESAALYQRLAEMYPSDVEVRAGLGWALLKGGKAPEAAAAFRAVLDVAPRNALAASGLRAAGAAR